MEKVKKIVWEEQLVQMGFPASVAGEFRLHELVAPNSFQLHWSGERGKDLLKAVLHFDRKEGVCLCTHYDVTLRKRKVVPDRIINEFSLRDLEQKIQGIDWLELTSGRQNAGKKQETSAAMEVVEQTVVLLQSLSATDEGEYWAKCLKLNAWIDSPFEKYILGIQALKSEMEISQRFYFSEDEVLITLDEAYRFLHYKWRDREIRGKRVMEGKRNKKQGKPVKSIKNGGVKGS